MMRAIAPIVLVCSLLAACQSEDGLSAFRSDGCSLFPDSALIGSADWCECCFAHDVAYWKGGTQTEREQADRVLRDCVRKKTGDSALAEAMYIGVRAGGSPYFYNWYRWGYGWPYARGYQALSRAETRDAERLLAIYHADSNEEVCR